MYTSEDLRIIEEYGQDMLNDPTTHPSTLVRYAINYIRHRWENAEPRILRDPISWEKYEV